LPHDNNATAIIQNLTKKLTNILSSRDQKN